MVADRAERRTMPRRVNRRGKWGNDDGICSRRTGVVRVERRDCARTTVETPMICSAAVLADAPRRG
jgi:hypothetical protein